MNTRKSIYNILSGIFGQTISIVLGIMNPRLVIVSLGSESNGLLSSVNQILVYLNLLESGVGTAALQALYPPVAEENRAKINGIMAEVNHFYKKISLWYLLIISVISLLLPFIIQSELPFSTICLVVLLSGLTQAASFALQGAYSLLIQAEGRNYILTNIRTLINIGTSITKIILLLKGFQLIAIQSMYCAASLIQFIYIGHYVRKSDTWLNFSAKPDAQALSQKNSVLIHQISGLIFQNTDVILLTFICGLKIVSVYTMYTMLFSMVATGISTINSSVSFIMGQTYHTDREKFMKLYNAFETYNMALTFSLYCIAQLFILPFLKIYTRGVTDINYIDVRLPVLFVSTYLLSNGRSAAQRIIEYAGHFRLTRNQSLTESAINILVSSICVFKFGIYGVLFGTIAALLYRTNEMIRYASGKLLKRSSWITYRKWGSFLILYLMYQILFSNSSICQKLTGYPVLILAAACSCLMIIPGFFILGSVIDQASFRYCRLFLMRYSNILHKKR